jgi:hypothetical protein
MLASFLGVLPILTAPLCALAFIICLSSLLNGQKTMYPFPSSNIILFQEPPQDVTSVHRPGRTLS